MVDITDETSCEIRLQSWLIRRASILDRFYRGFFADLLRLPVARRQAVFAALSRIDDDVDYEIQIATISGARDASEFGRYLLTSKAPDVVETAFGKVPAQFVGALTRCGPTCLANPRHYRRLFEFFDEVGYERHRRVVIDVGRITSRTITVIDALDPMLLDHRIVQSISEKEDVTKLTEAFRLLRSVRSTTDDEWEKMIGQMAADGGKIMSAMRRWTQRVDYLPSPPFAGGAMLQPLATASELVDAAGRFRNCLKGNIHLVLAGRVAYYEHIGSPAAIIEIAPFNSGQWAIVGVYGVDNTDISRRLIPVIAAPLIEQGVLHQTAPEAPAGYPALLEVIRAYDDPWLPGVAA